MEDCCGNKGDMVVDGKVLQLGCGCDSIRVMRGKLPEMLEMNWKGEASQSDNARYTGVIGTRTLFFLAGYSRHSIQAA